MIKIVDSNGQEQDATRYRQRIQIPPEKYTEMKEWVKESEDNLNKFNVPDEYLYRAIANFCSLAERFLTHFTYTQNLLQKPYTPSKRTVKQMGTFRRECCWVGSVDNNTEYWAQSNNRATYYLEKAIRAGASEPLDEELDRNILSGEEFLFGEENYMTLIKFLGRHRGLGLSLNLDPEKRKVLQQFVDEHGGESFVHDNEGHSDGIGFLCSAQRAGFVLPPIDKRLLDYEIESKVESSEAELGHYISALHHLHELLNPTTHF